MTKTFLSFLYQQMEANLKKILASIYLDGREICKKVYRLSNARELIDESKSQDGLPL